MNEATFQRLSKLVPVNNVGWFDVLDRNGAMQHWLDSSDPSQFNYAIWLLSQPALLTQRGARVAMLLRSALARQVPDQKGLEERRNGILRIFSFAPYLGSPQVWRLFMDLFAQGLFHKAHAHFWYQFHDLPEKNPNAAVELLVAIFDNYLQQGADEHSDSTTSLGQINLDEHFVSRTAQRAAEPLVRLMLPRLVSLIKANAITDKLGRVGDKIWPWLTLGFHHDLRFSLLDGVSEALRLLAKTAPELYEEYISGLESLPHQNISFLLLTSWVENPQRFADRSINYLLADPHRMDLGYAMWGTGNGTAAITRAAIASASPHCSEDALVKLESAILAFYPHSERAEARRLGYTQLLLLHAIDPKRLSRDAKARLEQLDRKFPQVDLSRPGESARAFEVISPIPENAAQKMTDDQWTSAMGKYSDAAPYGKPGHKPGMGGAHELATQLEAHARGNRVRFAALAMKMPEHIASIYFDALLRALTSNRGTSEHPTEPEPNKLADEFLFPVLRRIHELPNHPCGRWLSSSIGNIADRELPDDIISILSFYAIHGEEPQDGGEEEKKYFGGDLVNYGINTTRGAAAQALADLLFSDKTRWPKLEEGIRSVMHARSWSVRAVAISCLTALLNVDRSLAVELFLALVRETPALLSSMFVGSFLYHALFSHYVSLREVLLGMITAKDEGAREIAARTICIASFRFTEGEQDLQAVLAGDEICRAALASCAAEGLSFPEASDRCRTWLVAAFSDQSKKVRGAASRCFHTISDEQLCNERLLIEAFIDSPAFHDNAQTLLLALDKAVHKMPDIICKIPEKAVAIQRQSSGEAMGTQWWTQQMANLVLRLYDQTRDAEIRKRCLDVLDGMIELDFGDVTNELGKLDRGY